MTDTKISTFLFHLIGFALHIYTLNCHFKFVFHVSGKQDFAGSFKYLTFINLLFQLFFFGLSTLTDILAILFKLKMEKLKKTKDYFLASVAFPFAMFVIVTFWSIYLFNRELIFPAALDQFIPQYVNHLLHTAIGIVFIDLILIPHKYPSRKEGLTNLISVVLTYFVWISFVRYITGRWPYPFMDVLNVPAFVVFLIICATLISGLYIIGERINRFCFGTHSKMN